MRELEARVTRKSVFRSAPDAENIGRSLKAIRRRDLEVGAGKSGGFSIPRGIDERVHCDFKDMTSRLKMRGLDLTWT
jgi:hypothetical protein